MNHQNTNYVSNLPSDIPQLARSAFGSSTISEDPNEYVTDVGQRFCGNHNKFIGMRLRLKDGRTVDALLKVMGGNFGLPFDEHYTRQVLEAVLFQDSPLYVHAMAPSESNRYLLMEEIKGKNFSSLSDYEEKMLAAYTLGLLARMNGIILHSKQEHIIYYDSMRRFVRLDLEWGLKPEQSMERGIGTFELPALESLTGVSIWEGYSEGITSGLKESYLLRRAGSLTGELQILASKFKRGFFDMDRYLKERENEALEIAKAAAKDPRTRITNNNVEEIRKRIAKDPRDILNRLLEWRRKQGNGTHLDYVVSEALSNSFM